MPSNNNTTSLSSHGIGSGGFTSSAARMISNQISRSNLEMQRKSDVKVKKFYDSVYQLVVSMSTEEKMSILTSYGDIDQLGSKASEVEINAKVAESLIIHLSERDIEGLLAQVRLENKKIVQNATKEIQKRSSAAASLRKQGFNAGTMSTALASMKKQGVRAAKKAIKDLDPTYRVGRKLRPKYGKLYKEIIKNVLPNYNKIDLEALAVSMGIDLTPEDTEKTVREKIATRVIMFVDLLLGKSKNSNFSGFIIDKTPYLNVLRATSFAYLIGEGISPDEVAAMRKNTRNALAQRKAMIKVEKKRSGIGGKFRKFGKTYKNLTGTGAFGSLEKGKDAGFLKEYGDGDEEDLINIAIKAGISESDATSTVYGINGITRLKRMIYSSEASKQIAIKRIAGKPTLTRKGRAEKKQMLAQLTPKAREGEYKQSTTSTGTPLVKLSNDGTPIDEAILTAIPVFIVGSGKGGINKAIKDTIKEDETAIVKKRRKLLFSKHGSENAALLNQEAIASKYGISSRKSDRELRRTITSETVGGSLAPVQYNITAGTIDREDEIITSLPVYVVNSGVGAPSAAAIPDDIKKGFSEVKNKLLTKDVLTSSLDKLEALRKKNEEKKEAENSGSSESGTHIEPKVRKNSRAKDKVSLYQVSVLSNRSLHVQDTYSKDIVNLLKDIKNKPDEAADALSTYFPSLFAGLAAYSISAPPFIPLGAIVSPMMAAAAGISLGKTAVGDAATIADNLLASTLGTTSATGARITRMATGGTASITGDAATKNIFANGAKPELVQSNGDMQITPLNKAGTTQKQKVDRMTTSERNSALATSIASHVVKFSTQLESGITELSNSGEAIKVYNIKPGIADKVDLGGTQVSLIELVAAINTQLQEMGISLEAQTSLLGSVASSAATTATNTVPTQQTQSAGNSNPFANGFPSSMDSILAGE